MYGIEVEDALAQSWISRFVFLTESVDQAKARILDAGFHKRKIRTQWNPGEQPEVRLPSGVGPNDAH